MDRTTLAALTALSLVGGIAAAGEFRAQPGEATLKDAERTYPRVDVESGRYPVHLTGSRRYRVDANTVTDVTSPDASKHRRASLSEDYELRWGGAAEGIAFLVADRVPEKYEHDKPETNRRFHRLDLGSMKWLEPFKLPAPSIERSRGKGIQFGGSELHKPQRHVLADRLLMTPRGIVVLCEETIGQRDGYNPDYIYHHSVGCHVSCYAPKSTQPTWTRAVRRSDRGHGGVGYSMSSYGDCIERLAYVPGSHGEEFILLCPGERDALTCLGAADGTICWRIPAIWEFERGFIGPSVFEHYIERFGMDYMDLYAATSPVLSGEEEEIDREELRNKIRWKMESSRKLTAARKAFYARYQGRITAGPIVALRADQFGSPRIYMAATRSLKPEPGCVEQPEHAFVYEIEPTGDGFEISGMTRLPRAVIGRPYRKVPGGIVLACDRGCMVRLRTYESVFGGMMGPGNAANDMILQIDWYREYLMRCPSAWLTANPPTDVTGFSKMKLFRPGKAYVSTKESRAYHLRINVVDLRHGLDRDLTLSVPFEGELPIPETGFNSFNLGHATERLHMYEPHAIWIDRLHISDARLTVVVAHGSDYTELTFDISAILADEPAFLPTANRR